MISERRTSVMEKAAYLINRRIKAWRGSSFSWRRSNKSYALRSFSIVQHNLILAMSEASGAAAFKVLERFMRFWSSMLTTFRDEMYEDCAISTQQKRSLRIPD